MITVPVAVAAVLCALLALASYLHLLYSESLRLRPRAPAGSLEFFEQILAPKLRLEPAAGVERFAAVKQCLLLLLALDMAWLLAARQPLSPQRLLEALLLAIALLIPFAYVAPHALATRTGGRWALGLVWPARALSAAVRPLLIIVNFSHSITDLGAAAQAGQSPPTPEQNIEALMDAGEEEGMIGQDDRKLIQSVVEFGDKTVREVMTPRPQIVALEAGASLEQLRQLLIDEKYSRIPILSGSIDNILGFVHVHDVLEAGDDENQPRRIRDLARPVLLAPETKRVNDLLQEMQRRSLHMAVVIDEYGNTAGLVTLEDLVEEIVGEIRDESEPASDVIEEPGKAYLVNGNLDLDRLKDLTGFRPDEDLESTTVSGLVTERLGRVPAPGEMLELDGMRIEVLASDGLRVERLRVRRAEGPAPVGQTA